MAPGGRGLSVLAPGPAVVRAGGYLLIGIFSGQAFLARTYLPSENLNNS